MNPRIKERRSPLPPSGERKGTWPSVLEQGANLLQDTTPLRDFDVYVVGLHCARDDPGTQMEAHHYCRMVNEDLLQCVLFDGNTRDANLVGVEYIVSERLFGSLPEDERGYWHPHNYEILSGQLAAPGLPAVAETALAELLLNSYGKTWHTWHTGRHDGEPGHGVPLGEPTLMWSFNRDGEADEALLRDRDETMELDTARRRARRAGLASRAHPQHGVDALRDRFPGSTPVPGVADVREGNGTG
ncbi:OBAP family protein [Prauserella shujinwangii]|nr:OBAP family protein [Prauserella shujinwangii]